MYWLFSFLWWIGLGFAIFTICTEAGSNKDMTFAAMGATVLFYYLNRLFFRLILRRGYFSWYFVLAGLQIAALVFLAEEYVFRKAIYAEVPNTVVSAATLAFVLVVNLQVTITKDWFRSVFVEDKLADTTYKLEQVKLNPHFFKNVLNDIYSLVYLKREEAAPAVAELKELMEYVIYETDVSLVPLDKELGAIQRLVNIQKYRLPPHVSVTYQLFIDNKKALIPPMIFFQFLENVFRHADLSSENALIDIKLRVKKNSLMYRVKSKLAKKNNGEKKLGGIGIPALENRLMATYGVIGFLLDSKTMDGYYYAKLEILDLKSSE